MKEENQFHHMLHYEVNVVSNDKTLKELQKEVDTDISQFKEGYFSPLDMTARMTEELGELAREVNHYYGEKPKKLSEDDPLTP